MVRGYAPAISAIVAGVLINNLSYAVDLVKDHTGVIILGIWSLAGIALGIALILTGAFMLMRASGRTG